MLARRARSALLRVVILLVAWIPGHVVPVRADEGMGATGTVTILDPLTGRRVVITTGR